MSIEVRYFEVEFAYGREKNYATAATCCMLAETEPTYEGVEEFFRKHDDYFHYGESGYVSVSSIKEISSEYAHRCFNLYGETEFPVYGRN